MDLGYSPVSDELGKNAFLDCVRSMGDALSQGEFWFSILQLDKLILLTCLALRTKLPASMLHRDALLNKGLVDQEEGYW